MAQFGSADWTIPLHVAVSVGTLADGPAAVPQEAAQARASEGMFGRSEEEIIAEAVRKLSLSALSGDGFSWPAALATVLCSHLSYNSEAAVRRTATRWGFGTCEFIGAADTECFVASTPEAVVVAFRGTQQPADWLINLNAAWTRAPFGDVHRGFYFALQSVRSPIEDALNEAGARRKKVILTGHSLGGALATIGAAQWYGEFPIRGVYTFGQPAVGFSFLRSWFGVRYPDSFFRFVNDDDVVTWVPPGYRHVGKLYRFTSRGRIRHESFTPSAGLESATNDTPTMTPEQFAQLKAKLQAARTAAPAGMNEALHPTVAQEGFLPSIADHTLSRYVEQVLKHVD